MSTALSKTVAIRAARTFVSAPHRRSSTDYVVYGPYRSSDPHGPSTEHQSDSYPRARAARSRWVARIALHLMGQLTEDARFAVEDGCDSWGSIESLVDAGLKANA